MLTVDIQMKNTQHRFKNIDDEDLTQFKYEIMDFSQSYINKGNYIEGRLHENT